MNTIIRKMAYATVHLLTLGRGVTRKINGIKVKFPTKYFRYFPADYEEENVEIIRKYIKEGDVVIDIGAHIGLMSVVLARQVGPVGKVYSFEPTPYTFKVLKSIISLNNLQNVIKPINKAVSAKSGTVTFNAAAEFVSNSIVSYEYNQGQGHKSITVAMCSIDDFVKEENIKIINFLKIDAEGVELQVLKGVKNTLKNFNPNMILALHPKAIEANGDTLEEIYDLLKDADYIVSYNNKELNRNDFCAIKELFDVLAIKNKPL